MTIENDLSKYTLEEIEAYTRKVRAEAERKRAEELRAKRELEKQHAVALCSENTDKMAELAKQIMVLIEESDAEANKVGYAFQLAKYPEDVTLGQLMDSSGEDHIDRGGWQSSRRC